MRKIRSRAMRDFLKSTELSRTGFQKPCFPPVLSNTETTHHMWPLKFWLKFSNVKNSVSQLQWPYFKCSIASDYCFWIVPTRKHFLHCRRFYLTEILTYTVSQKLNYFKNTYTHTHACTHFLPPSLQCFSWGEHHLIHGWQQRNRTRVNCITTGVQGETWSTGKSHKALKKLLRGYSIDL